jgi:hypothetical protein
MCPISTIDRRRDGSTDSYCNEHIELRAQALRDIASWLKRAVKFALLTIPVIVPFRTRGASRCQRYV